jgi:NAD+ synthase
MTDVLNIALAQLNPTVGDIQGNLARIRDARKACAGCDLLVCSELALIGYPPEDLVMRPAVIEATRRAVRAGRVSIAFSGRIGSKALTRGTYVATVTATNTLGTKSRRVSARFTIVGGPGATRR